MNRNTLQIRIDTGLARAAAVMGGNYQQYRPTDPFAPLSVPMSMLQGTVVADGGYRPIPLPTFGDAKRTWLGASGPLQIGDLLVGNGSTLFVADVRPGLPTVLVDCTAQLTLHRWTANGGYGGGADAVVAQEWPASVRLSGRGEPPLANLPGEARGGGWQILMPVPPGVAVREGIRAVDADGRRFVFAAVEHTAAGLHIMASLVGG